MSIDFETAIIIVHIVLAFIFIGVGKYFGYGIVPSLLVGFTIAFILELLHAYYNLYTSPFYDLMNTSV